MYFLEGYLKKQVDTVPTGAQLVDQKNAVGLWGLPADIIFILRGFKLEYSQETSGMVPDIWDHLGRV